MRVHAGHCNDRAAEVVSDENARAVLEVEDPLRRGDVVLKRRERFLYHGHGIAVLASNNKIIELKGRGFAPLAAVLSFLAGDRDTRGASERGLAGRG